MNEVIASTQNKFIKEAAQLQSSKFRKKLGKFILEGAAYISDTSAIHVEYLLVSHSRREEYPELCKIHTYRIVSDKLMAQLSDTVTPQGVLAVCRQPSHSADELAARGGLYLICEDVRDPGNLGTIIRTAAAAGVSAIFTTCGCADLYSSKVVRASSGAIFSVPAVQCDNADELVRLLQNKRVHIVATHLKAERLPYDLDLRGDCAIIIGNEAHGVSDSLARQCDALIKLPMPGNVQSLNASVAAGIIIYESLRQRITLDDNI